MTKNKKLAIGAIALTMAAGVCAFALTGCGAKDDADANITKAVSREDGSGTRGAFEELVKNSSGEDLKGVTYASCVSVTNSTDAVGTEVKSRYDTLGYMSMGSVAKYEGIQALSLGGVAATTQNVANGTYKLARPFNIVYTQAGYDGNDLLQNFVNYIESSAGQQIISENGYVTVSGLTVKNYSAYTGTKTSLSIGGSSSVTPLMQKLVAAYKNLNSGINVTVNQSDSGTGITQAGSGALDIGMASRALKSSETSVVARQIATDGIAIVVKEGSWLKDITMDQIYNLYKNGTAIEKK